MLETHRSPVPLRRSSELSNAGQRHDLGAGLAPDPDRGVLKGLSETIDTSQHGLDPILGAISDAALHLTGASGAAVAMWKNGTMVCRARSGETAPPLGARVSTESGISGECLRTGTILHCDDTESDGRVDAEVCGSLGLRSIAAVPIVGWHGTNGIIEVFSATPHAFSDEHLTWLKQLARLAEKARTLRPHGASAVGDNIPPEPALEPPTESDRLRDVVFAAVGGRKRQLVLGVAGLLVLFVLGFAIWLGFHTPDVADANAQTSEHPSLGAVSARTAANESTFKPSPGREFAAQGKPTAGTAVKLASKVDRIPESSMRARVPSVSGSEPLAVQRETPASVLTGTTEAPIEPPPIAAGGSQPDVLNRLLTTPVQEPGLALPISQGVSNGYLVHRVSPVYPPQARELRMQGAVRVDAIISEQGTIESVKVVKGAPVLARAAVEAIRQWRYKPYELNGKPVKIATTITVQFKLPQ